MKSEQVKVYSYPVPVGRLVDCFGDIIAVISLLTYWTEPVIFKMNVY